MPEYAPTLAIPLAQAQIDSANELHGKLTQWGLTDNALESLGKAFRDWTLESSLLKVAAINQLYGTNLYAIVRMAEHVTAVMASWSPENKGLTLVEQIATLPKSPEQKTQWHHYSFASKLAHFFIDAEAYPIYDSYAVRMAEYHLGPKGRVRNNDHPYLAYVTNLERLSERSGLSWKKRELDRYLWLAGQYWVWQKNPKSPINTELARLFASAAAQPTDALATLLHSMLGAG